MVIQDVPFMLLAFPTAADIPQDLRWALKAELKESMTRGEIRRAFKHREFLKHYWIAHFGNDLVAFGRNL